MENLTTKQLNEAVAKLMKAYENLQDEYETLQLKHSNLEDTNNQLKDEIDSIKKVTNTDKEQIGEVVNKIETLLSTKAVLNNQTSYGRADNMVHIDIDAKKDKKQLEQTKEELPKEEKDENSKDEKPEDTNNQEKKENKPQEQSAPTINNEQDKPNNDIKGVDISRLDALLNANK